MINDNFQMNEYNYQSVILMWETDMLFHFISFLVLSHFFIPFHFG